VTTGVSGSREIANGANSEKIVLRATGKVQVSPTESTKFIIKVKSTSGNDNMCYILNDETKKCVSFNLTTDTYDSPNVCSEPKLYLFVKI
jgi:hypothetical protein